MLGLRKSVLSFITILSCMSFSFAGDMVGSATVSELLDEARISLKKAYEVRADKKASYEFYRAEAFYKIAQEQTSKLNLEAGKAAALDSIEWAMKAISKAIVEGR